MSPIIGTVTILTWLFGSSGPPEKIGDWTYFANDVPMAVNRLPEIGYKIPSRVESYNLISFRDQNGKVNVTSRPSVTTAKGDFSIACSEVNRLQIGVIYEDSLPEIGSSVDASFNYYPEKISLEELYSDFQNIDDSWTFDEAKKVFLATGISHGEQRVNVVFHPGKKNKNFIGWDWHVEHVLEKMLEGSAASFQFFGTYRVEKKPTSLPPMFFHVEDMRQVAEQVVKMCQERAKDYRPPIE